MAEEKPPSKQAKAGMNKTVLVGLAIVAGAAAGVLLKGALGGKTRFDPVSPFATQASSELAGHPAADAVDTASNTFWAEAAEGDGTGQSIESRFPFAFKLAKVGIFPGRDGAEFLAQPRPKDVHIEFFDADDKVLGGKDVTLKDKPELQIVDVSGEGVFGVRIKILSVYPGQRGQEASITELQFIARR